jgi:hypothetical protein
MKTALPILIGWNRSRAMQRWIVRGARTVISDMDARLLSQHDARGWT